MASVIDTGSDRTPAKATGRSESTTQFTKASHTPAALDAAHTPAASHSAALEGKLTVYLSGLQNWVKLLFKNLKKVYIKCCGTSIKTYKRMK